MQLHVPTRIPGPIGVSNFGTMHVTHAGVDGAKTETSHLLLAPLAGPLATFSGSFEDAVAGATSLARGRDAMGGARTALALLDTDAGWAARVIYPDQDVVSVIDRARGDSAPEVRFEKTSGALRALVTSLGSIAVPQDS